MKRFFGVAVMLMATVAFFSCDPAESEYKYDIYYENIYTVNKHKVSPEFSDSLIAISNMDKFGLETGQRARMVLHYYYDYSTMKAPKWEISSIVEIIPTLPLQSKALSIELCHPIRKERIFRNSFFLGRKRMEVIIETDKLFDTNMSGGYQNAKQQNRNDNQDC